MATAQPPNPETRSRPYVPAKQIHTDYPVRLAPSLSRNCYLQLTPYSSLTVTRTPSEPSKAAESLLTYIHSHFRRVIRYARTSDYAAAATMTAAGPAALFVMERVSPSYVGRGGFAPIMRLMTFISAGCGFMYMYQRSCCKHASALA